MTEIDNKRVLIVDALNAYFEEKDLPYQALDWRDASGVIGQLAVLTRGILLIALIIIKN